MTYKKKLEAKETAPSVKHLLYNHEECLNPKVQVKARLGGMFLSPGAGETDARILGLISQPVQANQ